MDFAGIAVAASLAMPCLPAAPPPTSPVAQAPVPTSNGVVEYPGLPHVIEMHEGLLSGGVPDGDAGFDSLAALGVRTIISVDGAVPDVNAAKTRGMRTVHLPIGYDGMDGARTVALARAVRDLPRPIYIHCHHGKHRSPAAAATIAVALGWITNDQARARMRVAGTAPGYAGLWQCATDARPLTAAVLDAAPAEFPERTAPSSLVAAMVELDDAHARLRAAQRAGWRAPDDHPDLAPLADAGRLADLFRLLDAPDALNDAAAKHRTVLREWFAKEARASTTLESLLERAQAADAACDRTALLEQATEALASITASCTACHAEHRDRCSPPLEPPHGAQASDQHGIIDQR